MRIRQLVFLLGILANQLFAQQFTFVKQWDKRFGGTGIDAFQSFQQTHDGGYILGGGSISNATGDKSEDSWTPLSGFLSDYWIIKIDDSGNKEWDKRYGSLGNDFLHIVKQTKDSGYILIGPSGAPAGGDKTQNGWGDSDFWVVKVNSTGGKEWDRRYGGVLFESPNDIIQTKDGGYLIGGYSGSPISGDKTQDDWDTTYNYDDIWLIKIDAAGNKQWDKRFGGIKQESMYRILQTKDGGFILNGASNSDIGGDKTEIVRGSYDCWVVKIDSLGNKQWDKTLGGANSDGAAFSIETSEGGYLIAAGSWSGIGFDKSESKEGFWLIKVDSTGNKLWDKAYGQALGLGNFEKTLDNGFLLSGISNSNIIDDKTENNLGPTQVWIIKTDSSGNVQWDKTIFTTKYSSGYAIQTTDGCYAVSASTKSGIGGYKTQPNWDGIDSTYDYWLLKFCMEPFNSISPLSTDAALAVSCYPNPFTTDLSIALQGATLHEATFTITNALGQMIYTKQETNLAANYTKVLDLSPLAKGVYFVEVSTPQPPKGGEMHRVVKRVVKE